MVKVKDAYESEQVCIEMIVYSSINLKGTYN